MKIRRLIFVLALAALIAAVVRNRRSIRSRHSNSSEAAPDGRTDIGFMLAMHAAFRRDLSRLEQTADAATPNVLAGWDVLSRRLVVHHEAEDDDLWPVLRSKTDAPAIDQIVAEHERIADTLSEVERTLRHGGERGRVAHEFADLVRAHLDHEERDVLPLVEKHLTPEEWEQFLQTERARQTPSTGAEFMGWVLDDAEPEHADAIWREIPPPARVVYQLVLKPLYDRRHLWSTAA
jgi:hypothetical protein